MKNTLNFICEFIGEAMQIKKIFFFFLFIPTLILSQDIDIQSLRSMSDGDLKTYLEGIKTETLLAYGVYQIEAGGLNLFEYIKGDKDSIMGLPIKQIKEYINNFKS